MAAGGFPLRLYGFLLVVFGTVSTLTYKYQDDYRVMGLGSENAAFHHPLLQTIAMFAGEALCLLALACGLEARPKRRRGQPVKERFRPLSMLAPAVCDMIASVLQYLALTYTFASHVAVLLGVNSLFTGVFASVFLRQKLGANQWAGSACIAIGAAFIGGCSALYQSMGAEEAAYLATVAPNPLLGDLFAVVAQLVRPGQYILEERAVSQYDCTVAEAVGWEGLFGALAGIAAIPFFHNFHGPDGRALDNLKQAALQMRYSVDLQVSTLVLVMIACVYNFLGISITRNASSSVRAAVNALRTCSVWLVSLWVGWEQLCELQIIGFLCVVLGTSLFNEVIPKRVALRWMPSCCGGRACGGGDSDDDEDDDDEDGGGAGEGGGSADGEGERDRLLALPVASDDEDEDEDEESDGLGDGGSDDDGGASLLRRV